MSYFMNLHSLIEETIPFREPFDSIMQGKQLFLHITILI